MESFCNWPTELVRGASRDHPLQDPKAAVLGVAVFDVRQVRSRPIALVRDVAEPGRRPDRRDGSKRGVQGIRTIRSPQQAPLARPRLRSAARLIDYWTRIAKFHVSNLLPHVQKTGRHISLRRAPICVLVLFMRTLCEPYHTTAVQLYRAVLRAALSRLWKTFAFRLCSGRFGAILWLSAKRGGMPAELFEKVVM